MKRGRRLALWGVALLAVALLASACGGRGGAAAPAPTGTIPGGRGGGPPYDFSLTFYQGAEVVGREKVRFSDLFQGKPVVLNFFAGLCPPCRAELPHFRGAWEAYRGRVLFVGVDVGPFTGLGSFEDGRALLREFGITYPVGSPPDGGLLQAYRVRGIPTTFFFTPDGRVFREWTGVLTQGKLEGILQDLLKESVGP